MCVTEGSWSVDVELNSGAHHRILTGEHDLPPTVSPGRGQGAGGRGQDRVQGMAAQSRAEQSMRCQNLQPARRNQSRRYTASQPYRRQSGLSLTRGGSAPSELRIWVATLPSARVAVGHRRLRNPSWRGPHRWPNSGVSALGPRDRTSTGQGKHGNDSPKDQGWQRPASSQPLYGTLSTHSHHNHIRTCISAKNSFGKL